MTGHCQHTATALQSYIPKAFGTNRIPQKLGQKSMHAQPHGYCKLDTADQRKERRVDCNTGLAKLAVQCSADTFPALAGQVVINQSLVLRINICGENRHLAYTETVKT